MNDVNKIIKDAMQKNHFDISDIEYDAGTQSKKRRIEIFIFLSIIVLIIWSSFAEMEITVTTRGEIKQLNDIEKIQHLEGGILEELLISEGDYVYEGQPIARLKGYERGSNLNSLEIEVVGLRLEIEKLSALIESRTPNLDDFNNNLVMKEITFISWKEENKKNKSNDGMIKHDIEHKRNLISSMRTRNSSADDQLKLIQEQLNIKQELYNEEVASYTDVLNMKVQFMNMLREKQNLEEGIMTEDFEILKLEKTLIDAKANRDSDYYSQIKEAKQTLELKKSDLPTATDKVDRLTIYSPVEGKVDKIHFNYKSAVISPGESIADIVPLRSTLIAEAKIPRKDIGFIEVGQPAKIKIDTYSFTKYGAIEGTITSISRSPYEEKEELFYIAKIKIDKEYLEKNGITHNITPHMEFSADIKTGSRKIIDYAVKPVMLAIEDSFHER